MYLEHGHFVLSQKKTATSQHKLWGVKQPHETVRSVSRWTDVNRTHHSQPYDLKV